MGLEEKFTQALWGTVEAAKAREYIPHYFISMLAEHGGVETAKRLLATDEPQEGLFKLYELGALDESMEAVVIKTEYASLFTDDEIEVARNRLRELNFDC